MNCTATIRKCFAALTALVMTVFCLPAAVVEAHAEGEENWTAPNPYYGGWSNCTWGAWQLVYNATGVALPRLGNAGEWYANAAAWGYEVSTEPRANSVIVWPGHVAYVVDFDGQNIYIAEGGYMGNYNEGWCDGYGPRFGRPIIGYIYIPADASQIVAPTYNEVIETYDYVPPRVDMAVDAAFADEQLIESYEEELIRMYIDLDTETLKDEEREAILDVQAEERQFERSASEEMKKYTPPYQNGNGIVKE
ncbi:MAG: CHAP domain-containing protein [Solobacterium sp.]|nr:CHAP domain-containing protein [Solobacterium sp.]